MIEHQPTTKLFSYPNNGSQPYLAVDNLPKSDTEYELRHLRETNTKLIDILKLIQYEIRFGQNLNEIDNIISRTIKSVESNK